MRYIDLDLLVADNDTQQLIETLDAARGAMLATLDSEARDQLIRQNQPNWVAFRTHFERAFGRKCWYTESSNPGTDDDIDHFRPKGRLAEDPDHGGYWWEALNWRNFRLSSHRANRLRKNPETYETLGKGDHFPLLNEEERCSGPSGDLARERPLLLDPTDPADPPLLTFDQDGRVALSSIFSEDDIAKLRFHTSRRYLHLDWPAFREDRQKLYTEVYIKVLDGDRANERFADGDAAAREPLKAAARDLIRMGNHLRPYSRAAQAYILRFRDRAWVKQIVLPHIPTTSELQA